ncbi:hypothetical protein ACFWN7_06745 [Agromyces sp. NPDC058484]|uniref:hypothetical protein n=1 Tax=Agromyces sp. NPDC058484 TaxID=3346524 RepID=UPI0036579FEA
MTIDPSRVPEAPTVPPARTTASRRRRRGTRAFLVATAALAGVLMALPPGLASGEEPASAASTGWWDAPNRPAEEVQLNVTGAPFTGTVAARFAGSSTRTRT